MTHSSGTNLDGDSRPRADRLERSATSGAPALDGPEGARPTTGRVTGEAQDESRTRSADARQLRSRNLRTLAALAALFFVPLLASAWLYYGMGWRPGGHLNHGELIQPPRPLPPVELPRVALAGEGAGPATPSAAALFRSNWTLVYIGDGSCDASCRSTLYVMRQTRLALGTDMERLARVFLVTANCCAKDYLAREHAGITVLDATGAAGARLLGHFPVRDRPHTLFVVDPMGNLMMRYDVRREPRGLLVDLKRLLELSQIG